MMIDCCLFAMAIVCHGHLAPLLAPGLNSKDVWYLEKERTGVDSTLHQLEVHQDLAPATKCKFIVSLILSDNFLKY